MKRCNKIIFINLFAVLATCFSIQANAAAYTPPAQASPFFDGLYLGVGAGVVVPTIDVENDYYGELNALVAYPGGGETYSSIIFDDENRILNQFKNLGKYGFVGTILGGFGKTFDASTYLGFELFANYMSPKMQGNQKHDFDWERSNGSPVDGDLSVNMMTKIKNKYSYGIDVRVGHLVAPKTMLYVLFGVDYNQFKIKSTA